MGHPAKLWGQQVVLNSHRFYRPTEQLQINVPIVTDDVK